MSLVTGSKLNKLWRRDIDPLKNNLSNLEYKSDTLFVSPNNGHIILDRFGNEMPQKSNLVFINMPVKNHKTKELTIIGATNELKVVEVPTVLDLVYNGQPQSPFASYDETSISLANDVSKINAGTYLVKLVLLDKEDSKWPNGTQEDKIIEWTIKKKKLSVPTVTGSFSYDGTTKTPTISEYDSTYISAWFASATNAGTYTVIFSLKDKNNTEWEDGTTADKTGTWSIGKQTVPVPSATNFPTYNGNSQSPTWVNYDTSLMTISGDTSKVNAGTYNAIFTLKNTTSYEWETGGSNPVYVDWEIEKAQATLTVDPNTITLVGEGDSKVIICTTSINGTITATPSDSNSLSTSVNSKQVTIRSLTNVSATKTVTITLAETTNYLGDSKIVTVSIEQVNIYGVYWDGSESTKWTRTDAATNFSDPNPAINNGNGSSPFDNLMPWAGMERVEDPEFGTFVKIPKFWYKWTSSNNDNSLKLQIADKEIDGFKLSPAHYCYPRVAQYSERQGVVANPDYVYIGAYQCAKNTYKSASNTTPHTVDDGTTVSSIRDTLRNKTSNSNSSIYLLWDYWSLLTIWMLYLVEFADWDSKKKIGYGCSETNTPSVTGKTDSMAYHTGTTASSRGSYSRIRYRYIEDLWSNMFTFLDGIGVGASGSGTSRSFYLNLRYYFLTYEASFSASGRNISSLKDGLPTRWERIDSGIGFDYIYPSAGGGSVGKYSCDMTNLTTVTGAVVSGGGYENPAFWSVKGLFGLFTLTTRPGAKVGYRLVKYDKNAEG